MSRGVTSSLNTELTSDSLEPFFAIDLDFEGGNVLLWTGYGNITFGGDTFVGSGDFLSIASIEETSEVAARGVTIGLSGLPASFIATALTDPYQGRTAKVYFGALSSGAVVADPYLVFSGRMDIMTIDDSGDTADITIQTESRLIDLERARNRRYTSEDQKIDFPNDKGLEFIADLQEKEVIWGG